MKLLAVLVMLTALAFPLFAGSGDVPIGFGTFQEDTLDSVMVGDTCAEYQGQLVWVPVYIRNPVHYLGGFEVKLYCGNPYDPYIIDYGYFGSETLLIDTTGSCASYFEYFVAGFDTSQSHLWIKAVGIADTYTGDTMPPLEPCDTFRLLFKVAVVVDSPVISPDTSYDTLAHLHLDLSQTRVCDSVGLYLYYPGLHDGHLQIAGWWFTRGDADANGSINVSDVIFLLQHLFPPQFSCNDAADCNDDGSINVSDAVFLLSHMFPPSLPEPNYPNMGPDPTPDNLGCCTYPPAWWFRKGE